MLVCSKIIRKYKIKKANKVRKNIKTKKNLILINEIDGIKINNKIIKTAQNHELKKPRIGI